MSFWLEFQWESQWDLQDLSPSTPLEVQLFAHFCFWVHDKPLVSDPLMVQSGWHSIKMKIYKMDCIDFNWILLTGKAIWYPIVNISRKEFLSLLCWPFWNSNISCIFLAFEMQQEDWKFAEPFWASWVMKIGFTTKWTHFKLFFYNYLRLSRMSK